MQVMKDMLVCLAFVLSLVTAALGQDTASVSGPTRPTGKNPELAGAIAVLAPGLGHVYAGETLKGGILAGLFAGAIGGVIAADIGDTHESIRFAGWAAVSFLSAVYLYSLIDAPFAAMRVNRHERATVDGTHMLQIPVGASLITLDAGMSSRGAAASLRLQF